MGAAACGIQAVFFNRIATKQPIGAFKAWLDLAANPLYDSRDQHFAARTLRDTELRYEARKNARDKAFADPDPEWRRLFKWEVPEHTAEPVQFL